MTEQKEPKIKSLVNMLEDVVNELDLSEAMTEKHGQEGTTPAELVRLVMEQKDLEIRMLKNGFKAIDPDKGYVDGDTSDIAAAFLALEVHNNSEAEDITVSKDHVSTLLEVYKLCRPTTNNSETSSSVVGTNCPEHGPLCVGAHCCCVDKHTPPIGRDMPEFVRDAIESSRKRMAETEYKNLYDKERTIIYLVDQLEARDREILNLRFDVSANNNKYLEQKLLAETWEKACLAKQEEYKKSLASAQEDSKRIDLIECEAANGIDFDHTSKGYRISYVDLNAGANKTAQGDSIRAALDVMQPSAENGSV